MRKLCRVAFLSAIALLSIQAATCFVPGASAADDPTSAPQAKKRTKNKRKNRKQKILKGHHSKRSRKPA